ncbi:MAG: hypothetical protein J1E02_08830 [Coprobacter sp.]|nr:hypothetical protein [Coprobacter sp.]
MNLNNKTDKITIDTLQAYKRSLKQEIAGQRERLHDSCFRLVSPFSRSSSASSLMGSITRSVAVFDGVMFGLRMYRKIRRIFRR